MKKRSVIVAMLCSMCLAVSTPIPAMADASKVVTLGADLTDEQKNTMMNYFKADASQASRKYFLWDTFFMAPLS